MHAKLLAERFGSWHASTPTRTDPSPLSPLPVPSSIAPHPFPTTLPSSPSPAPQDGDFSEERFRNIVNANLANDVGNLLNRTLNLLKKNCGGALPIDAAAVPADHPLRALAQDKAPAVAAAYERLRFDQACAEALTISGRGNQLLEETAPWTAFKKGS